MTEELLILLAMDYHIIHYISLLQVFTGDGAVIELGADVQFQITCAEKSVTNVQDLNHASRELVKATLVNQLVTYKMSEINANKSNIADAVLVSSDVSSKITKPNSF